jgi:hypothetical protein
MNKAKPVEYIIHKKRRGMGGSSKMRGKVVDVLGGKRGR